MGSLADVHHSRSHAASRARAMQAFADLKRRHELPQDMRKRTRLATALHPSAAPSGTSRRLDASVRHAVVGGGAGCGACQGGPSPFVKGES